MNHGSGGPDGDVMARAEPNAGHLAIQEWFEAGKLGGVITQMSTITSAIWIG